MECDTQGFANFGFSLGLEAYDTSYIFCKGTAAREGMPATFPSSRSLNEYSDWTACIEFTPSGSTEPFIAPNHLEALWFH